MEYGVGNRETFTRTFKDTYGITPAQYRDKPVGLMNYDKPDLSLNYKMVDESDSIWKRFFDALKVIPHLPGRWLKSHGWIADGFFPEMYYNLPEMAYMEMWIPFRERKQRETLKSIK